MQFECGHRVVLEVNLSRLEDNFRKIARRVAPSPVMAVLKANAYGLGVLPVAKVLKKAGAFAFGVAEFHEAHQLRELGLPVQILGNLMPDEVAPAIAENLIVPLADLETARMIDAEAARQHKTVRGALAIDSGMGRLGFLAEEALAAVEMLSKLKNIEFYSIFSHFSCAFNRDDPYSLHQLERFKKLLAELKKHHIEFPYVHMAASDALNNFYESTQAPFNLVRCGINMYGFYDPAVPPTMDLRPVAELKTRLAAIRTMPAGASLGYGRMHTLLREARIGIVGAGYADGLPLALSNRGYMLVRGELCPVLGRISMDYSAVLLDNVPDAKWGDEVVCFGRQGTRSISLESWAALKGTHAYELLCSIGTRVGRVYLEDSR